MVTYILAHEGDDLSSWIAPKPYKALVIVESEVSPAWQRFASRWLVNTGCLSMLAWGDGCESWNDSVDDANIEQWHDHIPDAAFVMTSWYDHHTLDDLFWAAKHVAFNPVVELSHALILHIGTVDMEEAFVARYIAA